jgi:D-arabinose 1-dehydrogenase-like Zn-dependent alcohol dehydrogenase
VAIVGIGGLGHLEVHFANRIGFKTVVVGRGGDKGGHGKKAWGATLHWQQRAKRS